MSASPALNSLRIRELESLPKQETFPIEHFVVEAKVPEKNKKTGVYYAITHEGFELPIVDVTHSAFALHITEQQLAKIQDEYVQYQVHNSKRIEASLLEKMTTTTSMSFLGGMSTYILKLGEENLGTFASPLDRLIANSLPAIAVRIRLQDMAYLQSETLIPLLQEKNKNPLHILNIAGGPALDSLNMLRLIPRVYLNDREITIHVLDLDNEGPWFGRQALTAWQAEGAPLTRLNIQLHHVPYNWAHAASLRSFMETLSPHTSILVAASEGGLFEYGTDTEIRENLRELFPYVSYVAGSIIRRDQQSLVGRYASVKPRSLEDFQNLVKQSGWSLARFLVRPIYYHVILKKQ